MCDMLQLHANQEDEVVAGLGSADAAAGTATSKPHITHVPHVLQYFRWHSCRRCFGKVTSPCIVVVGDRCVPAQGQSQPAQLASTNGTTKVPRHLSALGVVQRKAY